MDDLDTLIFFTEKWLRGLGEEKQKRRKTTATSHIGCREGRHEDLVKDTFLAYT